MILYKLTQNISERMPKVAKISTMIPKMGVALCAIALLALTGCPDGGTPDTAAPVIALTGRNPRVLEIGREFTDPGATVTDNDLNYPITMATAVITNDADAASTPITAINTATVGTYTITYTADDDAGGNTPAAVTRTVQIVPRGAAPPVITRTGSATVMVELGGDFTDLGAMVIDNDPTYIEMVITTITDSGDAIITEIDTNTADIYTITYTAQIDSDGNDATPAIRTVTVADTIQPMIALTGAATLTVEVGGTIADPGATVMDNDPDYGTDMATATLAAGSGITISGTTISGNTIGTYTITYTADNDAGGNMPAAVTRMVTVADTTIPVITLTGAATLTVNIGADFDEPGAEATDNDPDYGTVMADATIRNSGGTEVAANAFTAAAGTYTITYTALADATGNTPAAVTRTVQVVNPIDRDNDRLIDIDTIEDLDAIRHNLDGTSYLATADATALLCGADATTACIGYELTRNLDFAAGASYASGTVNLDWRPTGGGTAVVPPGDATNPGWDPIGDCNLDTTQSSAGRCNDPDDDAFTATFAGNDFTIANLYARQSGSGGLFEVSIGTIQDIGIVNANIYGGAGIDLVGGLVGENIGGTITTSYATGSVNGGAGNDDVGGLVGSSFDGTITASYATGSVNGGGDNDVVGGLVGSSTDGTITASYATGDADGGVESDIIGGLVGNNNSTITASYATGDVDGGVGNDFSGGLVGNNNSGAITATYATGNVDGGAGTRDFVGSLTGNNSSTTTASYGFGVEMGRTVGTPGIARSSDTSSSVATACALTRANSSRTFANRWHTTTAADRRWQWDFGTATQRPIVLYDGEPVSGQTNRDCG